jgi:hypothetical protein
MKISEAIKRVRKEKQFEDQVYIGDMAEKLFNVYISNDEDQERLTSYYIGSWHCTDSRVGYKVYFFDDEPVAASSQTGRKMGEDFEWISKEGYRKVKDYIFSFSEEDNIDLIDLDEDIEEGYKISYNCELYNYHKEIPLYEGKKVKIVELEKNKDRFGIDTKLKIQFEDKKEIWVEIGELIFPYNVL